MKYIDKETGNERKTRKEIEKNLFELKGNTSEFDDYDLDKFIAEFYVELPADKSVCKLVNKNARKKIELINKEKEYNYRGMVN